MAQYVTPQKERVTAPVGLVQTVIVPVTSLRGSEEHVVEIINDGTEEFNGVIEASFTGDAPFVTIPLDDFTAMGVGISRIARIAAAWQFYRVRGLFATTPGNVRYSVAHQKWMAHK